MHINIHIDDETKARIVALAQKQGVRQSEIIRHCIRLGLWMEESDIKLKDLREEEEDMQVKCTQRLSSTMKPGKILRAVSPWLNDENITAISVRVDEGMTPRQQRFIEQNGYAINQIRPTVYVISKS